MEQYHGTDGASATLIANGRIDRTLGGGELGQGFYAGDLAHEAFNWAHFRDAGKVVKITVEDDDLLALNPLCLELHRTHWHRRKIRDAGTTRTFVFGHNVIWAPVVGKHIPNFNQLKYESQTSQDFLNGNSVTRVIL